MGGYSCEGVEDWVGSVGVGIDRDVHVETTIRIIYEDQAAAHGSKFMEKNSFLQ